MMLTVENVSGENTGGESRGRLHGLVAKDGAPKKELCRREPYDAAEVMSSLTRMKGDLQKFADWRKENQCSSLLNVQEWWPF